jgi:flavin reductase (DIM6/NTAB) family NADH-FMN oxidoreductase RutF
MAGGWVSCVNYQPPMVAISLGSHLTNEGILENQAFSINIPDMSLVGKTDYCGLFSSKKVVSGLQIQRGRFSWKTSSLFMSS